MIERVQSYVDNIFGDYEESVQLREFKEEVIVNLMARIEEATKTGQSEDEAFQSAIKELGDVREIAEEISLQKKYEVIDQMFIRKPLEKKWALGYTVATGIILFGIITSLIVYFQSGSLFIAVSTNFPFTVTAVAAFVFIALVRETEHQYGMKVLRASFYTLATILVTSGIFISFIVYLERSGMKDYVGSFQELATIHNGPLFTAISVLIPFILPGICIFTFLALTEKDRSKPNAWTGYAHGHMDSKDMMVYGNLSGALWIFSIGLFILLGILWTWKFSWIVFIFAVGFQVLLTAFYDNKREK